jgi:hypothetical protein
MDHVIHTEFILKKHPLPLPLDHKALSECVEACMECEQACTACADACLGEGRPDELVRMIRLNQDCADICSATARILSRQTATVPRLVQELLHACALACKICGEECLRHGGSMDHCRVCADACDRCQEACTRLIAVSAASA